MTPNEHADPVVIAVYQGLIQPTIDGFCSVHPNAAPEEIAAVTHNAILMGTSLIRVSRIAAGLDRVEVVHPGTSEVPPTFEYIPTVADTSAKREQIAGWVSEYLRGGRVGAPREPSAAESEVTAEDPPSSSGREYVGQYL